MDQNIIERLPPFATYENGVVIIDPDKAYSAYLEEMGMEMNQYSVEVARRCLTLDLLDLAGPGLHIKIANPPRADGSFASDTWAQINLAPHPEYGEQSAELGRAHGPRIHRELKARRGG